MLADARLSEKTSANVYRFENEKRPCLETPFWGLRFRCCYEEKVELADEYEGTVAIVGVQRTTMVRTMRRSFAVDADQ